jgi:hypothetical protein
MSGTPTPAPDRSTRGGTTLPRLAIGMFLLLAVELVLGVVLALFVNLPTGSSVVAILTSTPVLDLHILVALFIVGISIRALALARSSPGPLASYAALLALVSALVATGAGWLFAFHGQDPDASLVMTVGFLGVLLAAFLLRGISSRTGDAARTGKEQELPT